MSDLEVELVEPVREVVEVVEQGDHVVYVVEPTAPQAVPRVLADLDDVAPDTGFDGQVLTLVDGVWTPVNAGGVGGGVTLAEVDALFPRTTEVAADLAAGLAGKEDTGTATAAVLAHTSAADPHPGYVRDAELGGLVAPLLAEKSDTGHTHAIGDVTGLQAALNGKETAGAAVTSMAVHVAAADPHPQYLTTAEGDARFGNLFKEAEQDGRLAALESRPVIDSPDDIGAQPAGSYATDIELAEGLATKADDGHTHTPPPRVVNTPVALVDAASIATDAAAGNNFRVTLGGNRTLGAPTNPVDGQRCTWLFTQDGTGNRTITLAGGAGGFAFGTDITAFVLSTAAGTSDMLGAEYHAGRDRWLVLATAKGY